MAVEPKDSPSVGVDEWVARSAERKISARLARRRPARVRARGLVAAPGPGGGGGRVHQAGRSG